MVMSVTSLTGNGLKDWLIQRITSVYLALYVLFFLPYFFWYSPFTYMGWHQLFMRLGVRIASTIMLLSLLLHGWVGLWTITTDYLKCNVLRLGTQVVILLVLLSLLIWGTYVFWR